MQDPNSSKPRKTLAQRTIELIQTEGQFDMAFWAEGEPNNGVFADAPHCGTACCIAGNIAIAAKERGLVPYRGESTAAFARRVWAAEYGPTAARELDFFNNHGCEYDDYCREIGGFARTEDGERKALEDVTPAEAVAHVLSTLPSPARELELERYKDSLGCPA